MHAISKVSDELRPERLGWRDIVQAEANGCSLEDQEDEEGETVDTGERATADTAIVDHSPES